MRKNLKVIQINGFRGICMALAILTCLIAGFVAFPGLVLMFAWNFISNKTMLIPQLGIIQGVLLWGIIVVSYMILKKRHVMVSFKTPTELSEEELDEVMERIKIDTTTKMMSEIIAKSKMDKKPTIISAEELEKEISKELEISNKNVDN